MKLSRYEQETIITYNAKEKMAEIYSANTTLIKKLDDLCSTFPEMYKLKTQDKCSKTYTVPKEYITFRKPRVISEQHKEKLMQNLRKKK